MINLYLKRLLIIAFFISSSFAAGCTATALQEKEDLEQVVREFVRSIHKKDFDRLLELIPGEGVVDSDNKITRIDISIDLKNKTSDLYKRLYEVPSNDEIKVCLEKMPGQRIMVSPFAFYERYRESYVVEVTPESESVYQINIRAPIDKKISNQCVYGLWPLFFQKIGGKYYLQSYFFG
jgi:hypothetical protein